MGKEEWRDIKGYEGRYQVSSLGNVRSLPYVRHQPSSHPGVMMYKHHPGKIMRATDNGNGYKIVSFKNGSKRKNHYVHRLVAEAFLPNHDGRSEVNHIDYDKGNNTVENLEWVTRTENIHWSRERMMHPTKNAKLTNLGMRYISKRYGKFRVSIHNKRLGYQIDKYFETLEEAIAAKEAYISGKEYFAGY